MRRKLLQLIFKDKCVVKYLNHLAYNQEGCFEYSDEHLIRKRAKIYLIIWETARC